MAKSLILHYLPPSPNNIKVSIALSYKGVPFDVEMVDRTDRSKLVEISGQPLSPVIQHDGKTIFDSGAILRYIDANFEGPRLFSADREEMKAIEQWESHHKAVLGPALGRAFGIFFAGGEDLKGAADAGREMTEASAELEAHLEGRDWLVGDSMSAADIWNASILGYSCFPENVANSNPLWSWFSEQFRLGEGRDRCRSLVERVFAYLPKL